jgi:predicted phage-related endonuclease
VIERHAITDRQIWLAMRRDFLTASDVPAVAGVDSFRTPFDIYADKAGGLAPVTENAAMRRGRLFENAALEYLREDCPDWRVLRPNVFLADNESRLGCTPDALTEDENGGLVNLQIKTISRPSFEKWNGEAPLGYRLQVCTENLLLDAATGYLVVLAVSAYDAELHLFEVPRHAAVEARIKDLATEFWDNIAHGRRPAPDYSRDGETIAAMFPRQEPGKTIDLSTDNRLARILPQREELKDTIDGARKELEALDAEVKFKLGDAEAAELPGWRLTWKEEYRKAYTVEESTRRVLRVKQIEQKEQAA